MMKKILMSVLAATVALSPLATTAASAQSYRHGPATRPHGGPAAHNRHDARQATGYRKWAKGQRFDRRYAQNYRQVDYRQYRGRGLYAPPRGYQWAQSGNDAVLIAVASGLIGAVLGGALR